MGEQFEQRAVPFFDYRRVFSEMESEFVDIFRDVLRRGAFIMQSDLINFEKACADFLGVKYAFGVGNATDGLHFVLRAAGVGAGHEVLVPGHTMVATPAAVVFAGATPVLVDIGEDHLMDSSQLPAALTPRTRAIMPVHVNGRSCDMLAISAFAKEHGLAIVEDAAQAMGSRFGGRFSGTWGDAAAFSFYPAKVLGCLGDGGLVVTGDDDIAESIMRLRDHGRGSDGVVRDWGLNSRLDNLQAAFLAAQFKRYPAVIEHRRELARCYEEGLASLDGLLLPPGPHSDPQRLDIFQNYEIRSPKRDTLKAFLAKHEIGTLIQWGGSAPHHFSDLQLNCSLPKTDEFFEECIMLPLNPAVSPEDVDYVCDRIRAFFSAQEL